MKYPLRIVEPKGQPCKIAIADAGGLIVCLVAEIEGAWEFAQTIVRAVNEKQGERTMSPEQQKVIEEAGRTGEPIRFEGTVYLPPGRDGIPIVSDPRNFPNAREWSGKAAM